MPAMLCSVVLRAGQASHCAIRAASCRLAHTSSSQHMQWVCVCAHINASRRHQNQAHGPSGRQLCWRRAGAPVPAGSSICASKASEWTQWRQRIKHAKPQQLQCSSWWQQRLYVQQVVLQCRWWRHATLQGHAGLCCADSAARGATGNVQRVSSSCGMHASTACCRRLQTVELV
jgi:hypothetical protein